VVFRKVLHKIKGTKQIFEKKIKMIILNIKRYNNNEDLKMYIFTELKRSKKLSFYKLFNKMFIY